MADPPSVDPPSPDPKQEHLDPSIQSDSSLPAESEANRTTDFTSVRADDSPGAPTLPPHAFGRYEVLEPVGSGSFGAVYRGYDTQLHRPVALKVLRAGATASPQEPERFLQEARRVARLRHPGIATVHDVGVQDGQVYIVSDFIAGGGLDQWLRNNRPTWQEAVRIVAAVSDALAHAHSQLTLHRDVKPANILLTPDGTPVLVDFGLGIDESDAGGAELGIVAGTPAYMSPEQVSGAAHRIDGRTDVYCLGVVLYEMLTGHLPFRARSRDELLRQVCEDPPQPPRQIVRAIPPELERICLRAMAKQMPDRYTTAADFADALRSVLHNEVATVQSPAVPRADKVPSGEAPGSIDQPTEAAPPVEKTSSSLRRAREAERRQVTVLVFGCDLFASEEFLEGVDPEDQARVLRELQDTCQQVVRRFGGTVIPSTIEGLLVCFGYPVAYEDAAPRAVRAGLGILDDVKVISEDLRRKHRVGLNPWIGIHTGLAVVAMSEDAISLVGEARNVALRLEDHAEVGQVLCSQTTHRLIQNYFECESAGNRKIKGLTRHIELFRVRGAREAQSPVDAAGDEKLTPLTGRRHEVALLMDRWEQAQEGMGQVVLIIGEAGLGKSRLVYSIKQHVREQVGGAGASEQTDDKASSARAMAAESLPIIEWRCSPHSQNSVLYPASTFFERFLGFQRDEAPQARVDRLIQHLEEHQLARPDAIALFAALLSLPLPDQFPPLNLSPVRQREETLRALQDWLRAYAERQSVLFIIEDLHWIDASSLEFLSMFVAEGLHDHVLTLLTFRPEFQTPWPAVAHQTSLALNRFTRRQVAEMMENKTGIKGLPKALVDQVHDRTNGVPLFVEEFTKMVQESGTLEQLDEDSTRTRAVLAHEIPASLQDLVMARLDRMAIDHEVAQLGATLGREFSHDLLAAVSTLDEDTLATELNKLVQADLLYRKGQPPQCTYLFKHALLQDAAYNSLVKSKRRLFHERIAEVLEGQFPETVGVQPELLAYHCIEADLTDKAIEYSLKAALRSRDRSAEVEAISHLTQGLALLDTLDESTERDLRELAFQSPLGTAYLSTRGYAAPEVGPVFRRARELCERVGEPPQLFAVMWGTWAWHVVRGDFRLCMDLAAEAMELAEKLGDPGITMEALFMPGLTMLYRADFAGARARCERAVADYDDRERTKFWATHTGQSSGVTHRCYLSLALWHLGYADQALKVNREMVELARTIHHPFSLAYALHHTGWLFQHCRLGAEAQAAGEEAIRISEDQGFAFWHATGTLYTAAGLLQQGRRDEALPLMRNGLDAYRATGAGLALPFYLCNLGDALMQAGSYEEAMRTLDEGLAVADKNDDGFQEAELHRLKGQRLLLESQGQAALAEASFQQALKTARRQQSKAWELRSTMSLARLWNQQGRRDEARDSLAKVYESFTEGWDTPDLADARFLLQELS